MYVGKAEIKRTKKKSLTSPRCNFFVFQVSLPSKANEPKKKEEKKEVLAPLFLRL
jgi:hypothetical protein